MKLYQDFQLEIRYRKSFPTPQGGTVTRDEVLIKDLRNSSVLIVPEEVAQNRKRRWSKKFPLSISWSNEEKGHIFLFPFTSREKEDWFRRLRSATEGTTYDQLVKTCSTFYHYMGNYMPRTSSVSPLLTTSTMTSSTSRELRSHTQKRTKQQQHRGNSSGGTHRQEMESVRFSATDSGVEQEEDLTVSIHDRDKKTSSVQRDAKTTSRNSSASHSPPIRRKYLPESLPLNLAIGWINAGLARLAWDLWHEDRWKNWITSRIQRKLIRIKTPSFMEELKVTEVNMGMDMPILKGPSELPRLNQQGLWVYLEVEYIGSFTMTIETKLKLEPRGLGEVFHFNASNDSHSSSPSPSPEGLYLKHKRHHRVNRHLRLNYSEEDEEISSGSDEEGEDSRSLINSLEEKLPRELETQVNYM